MIVLIVWCALVCWKLRAFFVFGFSNSGVIPPVVQVDHLFCAPSRLGSYFELFSKEISPTNSQQEREPMTAFGRSLSFVSYFWESADTPKIFSGTLSCATPGRESVGEYHRPVSDQLPKLCLVWRAA
jgi:hypothetical protein